MVLSLPPELIALALFVGGVALVLVSVETFVGSVAESALALGVSGFFLTVVLAAPTSRTRSWGSQRRSDRCRI